MDCEENSEYRWLSSGAEMDSDEAIQWTLECVCVRFHECLDLAHEVDEVMCVCVCVCASVYSIIPPMDP